MITIINIKWFKIIVPVDSFFKKWLCCHWNILCLVSIHPVFVCCLGYILKQIFYATFCLISKLFNLSKIIFNSAVTPSAQKMRFSIKDFFSKCDHIRRKLRIWSHVPKKSLMENFIFSAVSAQFNLGWIIPNVKQKYMKHLLNIFLIHFTEIIV